MWLALTNLSTAAVFLVGQPLPPPRRRVDSTLVWSRLQDRENAIRHCYEQGLRLDDRLAGRLVLQIDIDGGGTAGVRVVDSELTPQVDACIVQAVAPIELPPTEPDHLIQASFPYTFRAVPQVPEPALEGTYRDTSNEPE